MGSSVLHPCPDCQRPCYGECCHPCRSKRQIIRAEGEHARRRQREQTAPGLRPADRERLRQRWVQQRKSCAYCDRPATTIDHVVPLVRGGSNYEGNLAPCCRSCNARKGGRTVIEWRTGKRLPRMTHRVHVPPIVAIVGEQPAFSVCPECSALHTRPKYCSVECSYTGNLRAKREAYQPKPRQPNARVYPPTRVEVLLREGPLLKADVIAHLGVHPMTAMQSFSSLVKRGKASRVIQPDGRALWMLVPGGV